MKKVCAWCGVELAPDAEGNGKVSHGICQQCRWYFFPPGGGRTFRRFLDLLPVPVVVVDDDVRVVVANSRACSLLGKEPAEIEGGYGGEALECAYARLPEGCGKTVHCRSCTVRLTVLDTFATGQSHYDVPACMDIRTAGGDTRVAFLITTEKSGELVLLKIVAARNEQTQGPR